MVSGEVKGCFFLPLVLTVLTVARTAGAATVCKDTNDTQQSDWLSTSTVTNSCAAVEDHPHNRDDFSFVRCFRGLF